LQRTQEQQDARVVKVLRVSRVFRVLGGFKDLRVWDSRVFRVSKESTELMVFRDPRASKDLRV
jgi:hypothetical protein